MQNNRFICNWRKVLPSNEYPSFTKMRYRFEKAWDKFHHFVQQEQLGTIAATQCEVTYFNHIEFSSENSGWAGLDSIFPQWSCGSSSGFLPEPEAINMNLTYPIPDRRGRLRFSLEPVFRHADAKELIQFTVAAKIIPSTEDGRTVMEAIELGHEWAVCGFADFTSAEMHQIWQRKQ